MDFEFVAYIEFSTFYCFDSGGREGGMEDAEPMQARRGEREKDGPGPVMVSDTLGPSFLKY